MAWLFVVERRNEEQRTKHRLKCQCLCVPLSEPSVCMYVDNSKLKRGIRSRRRKCSRSDVAASVTIRRRSPYGIMACSGTLTTGSIGYWVHQLASGG